VIVHNLHVQGIAAAPDEADAPLIVNTNAVLTMAIPVQGFQMIPRRGCQIAQFRGAIQLPELSLGYAFKTLEAPTALAVKESFRLRTAKGLDHWGRI
jgi:hypothetical protein